MADRVGVVKSDMGVIGPYRCQSVDGVERVDRLGGLLHEYRVAA